MPEAVPACAPNAAAAPLPRAAAGEHAHELASGLRCRIGQGTPDWPAAHAETLQFALWLRGHGLVHDGARALRIPPHHCLGWRGRGAPPAVQASTCALHVTLRIARAALQALAGADSEAWLDQSGVAPPLRVAAASSRCLHSAHELVTLLRDGGASRLLLDAKCLELLAHLLAMRSDARALPLSPAQRAALAHARERLFDNLADPPTPAELARGCGLNPHRFKQAFRSVYGQSIHAACQAERMRVAWQLIASGETDVGSAGHQVGYANLSHFSVAFQRHFGLRPSELKRCAAQAP